MELKNSNIEKTLIIIPAYNEEERIQDVISRCMKYVSDKVDLIVVNDGSTDRTLAICDDIGVNVISIPFNHGVGNALKTGFLYALKNNYENVITIDADGQHNPDDLPKFIQKLETKQVDIVIGSRFINGIKYDGSIARIIGNKFFAWVISVLIREKLTDVTSGFRGMNRAVLSYSVDDVFNFDYPDADFLLTLHRAGFHFSEIPVEMNKRIGGESQHKGVKPIYYIFKMLLSIFIILMRKKNIKKP